MISTPNIASIREEALNTLEKEYDLEKNLNKYSSIMPELIEFIENLGLGLTDENKYASRILFISDYIFTSSEVPPPPVITDEERRADLASMFSVGLKRKPSDVLLKIFYLATKTHSMIRRSDVYMAGRGVLREASLIILKDIYVDAYLEICADLLGEGPCGWELAVLSSSMNKTLPSKEYEFYKDAPRRTDLGKLFPFTWKLLIEYNKSVNTEVNDQIVIPNIENTSTLLGLSPSSNNINFSVWNFKNIPVSLKENQNVLKEMQEFVSQSDDTKPFIYLRSKILNSDQHLFLIRDPENTKPFFLLRSPVDEVNVTETLSLVKNRGSDIGLDPKVIPVDVEIIEKEEIVNKEIEEIKEVEYDKKVEDTSKNDSESSSTKKKGFFRRILSIFKKDSDSPSSQKKMKTVRDKKLVKETKTIQTKVKVKSGKDSKSNIPDFISYAVGVVGVGDLNLFQIFDTVRESNYIFSGVLYSDFKNNNSTFYASKNIDNPKSLTKIFDGLDVVVEKTINHISGGNVQIMPKEILFRGRSVGTNLVIIFEGNEDHLVGIMGTTYVKDESTYSGADTPEPETFQRRTLKMRTNQLLKTLQSVHRFEEVFTRVLGDELLKECQEYKFEHAILNIYS